MQLNITGQHITVSSPLKAHVQEKMKRLENHFDAVTNAHVVLKIEKSEQIAEATVHVSGADLFAQSHNSDMYVAIDQMVSKLDSQIMKHKSRMQSHRKG